MRQSLTNKCGGCKKTVPAVEGAVVGSNKYQFPLHESAVHGAH